MHREQRAFAKKIRKQFRHRFSCENVLDIGSLDINGNNRYLFRNSTYHGIDVGEGKNVDQVISGHEYKCSHATTPTFIISTECLEHNRHWKETIQNAYNILVGGGAMLITCASVGRPEHGVRGSHAVCSPYTNDYYKNISTAEFNQVMPKGWDFYHLEYNPKSQDLYFFGIKHNHTANEIYQELLKQNNK